MRSPRKYWDPPGNIKALRKYWGPQEILRSPRKLWGSPRKYWSPPGNIEVLRKLWGTPKKTREKFSFDEMSSGKTSFWEKCLIGEQCSREKCYTGRNVVGRNIMGRNVIGEKSFGRNIAEPPRGSKRLQGTQIELLRVQWDSLDPK